MSSELGRSAERDTVSLRRRALAALDRVSAVLARSEDILAALILVGVAALLILQVVSRYAAALPLYWSEEIARLGLVWVTLIGAAFVTSTQSHLTIVAVTERFPDRVHSFFKYFADIVVAASSIVMTVACVQLAFSLRAIHLSASGLPRSLFFIGASLGFGLMAFHALVTIIKRRSGTLVEKAEFL